MTRQHSDPIINSHGGKNSQAIIWVLGVSCPSSQMISVPQVYCLSPIKIKVAFIAVILIGGVVFNRSEVFFDFVVLLMLTAISFHFFFKDFCRMLWSYPVKTFYVYRFFEHGRRISKWAPRGRAASQHCICTEVKPSHISLNYLLLLFQQHIWWL